MNAPTEFEHDMLIECTAQIATAFVAHQPCNPDKLPDLIRVIGASLSQLHKPEPQELEFEPAVDPKKSIKNDHLIRLIDGKRYKMLRRHLRNHGLTPEQYRARFNLPSDYPMVAPEYSATRSRMAKEIGLGKQRARA